LDLDSDRPAVLGLSPETLADRGGRHGAVEFGEYIVNWFTEIAFEHRAHPPKRHGGA
jgi:hypothetical protein